MESSREWSRDIRDIPNHFTKLCKVASLVEIKILGISLNVNEFYFGLKFLYLGHQALTMTPCVLFCLKASLICQKFFLFSHAFLTDTVEPCKNGIKFLYFYRCISVTLVSVMTGLDDEVMHSVSQYALRIETFYSLTKLVFHQSCFSPTSFFSSHFSWRCFYVSLIINAACLWLVKLFCFLSLVSEISFSFSPTAA